MRLFLIPWSFVFAFFGSASSSADSYEPPAYDQSPRDLPAYPDTYADTDPSALTDVRGVLDPYGSWYDDPTCGTVWLPSADVVGADFLNYRMHDLVDAPRRSTSPRSRRTAPPPASAPRASPTPPAPGPENPRHAPRRRPTSPNESSPTPPLPVPLDAPVPMPGESRQALASAWFEWSASAREARRI
jgi:hypothetical protein